MERCTGWRQVIDDANKTAGSDPRGGIGLWASALGGRFSEFVREHTVAVKAGFLIAAVCTLTAGLCRPAAALPLKLIFDYFFFRKPIPQFAVYS